MFNAIVIAAQVQQFVVISPGLNNRINAHVYQLSVLELLFYLLDFDD